MALGKTLADPFLRKLTSSCAYFLKSSPFLDKIQNKMIILVIVLGQTGLRAFEKHHEGCSGEAD
jgi:hypothetical protein